ncbi:major facilitator superfamily domain-containing protein 9 isoform X2 [Octopus bimaculoides]|uniref:Major facilitator superfamily (MFS) profile domain-containing protein n=1 Tax=Octopus bimaculoides TaxID=37653 RepID=A0A0L8G7R9_OCTBM|nr:major facilitator superfamily domain-containing protein 9 isoform X2 [Octopus bimaculoides]|eukprot:XP_014783410.1 PREDICTED: major facilitator superfamily domain-containing protein 9-like isoform X1 [Octopus bimaculoides]
MHALRQRPDVYSQHTSMLPIYIVGFLDLLGVSMILPLIGPHVRDMGASSTVVGALGSVYGALQLFSSPIVGKWSDVTGRRLSLIVCMFFTAFGYSLIGFASSIAVIVAARVILGIFKHSLNISKSFIADAVPPSEQSSVLGTYNSFSSIGFIVGPTLGGHIAELPGGFFLMANLAGIIFLLNALIVWILLPTSQRPTRATLQRLDSVLSPRKLISDEINFNPKRFFQSMRKIKWNQLWDMFAIRFLLGFSIIVFRSNLNIMLQSRFNISPRHNGYLTSYSGIVSTAAGFLVGSLTKLYKNEPRLFFSMSVFQVVILFMLGLSQSFIAFIIFFGALSLATSVMRVVGTRLMLLRGAQEGSGVLLGLSQSFMSIARMISPFISGILMEINVSIPAFLGAAATVLASILIFLYPQDKRPGLKMKKS